MRALGWSVFLTALLMVVVGLIVWKAVDKDKLGSYWNDMNESVEGKLAKVNEAVWPVGEEIESVVEEPDIEIVELASEEEDVPLSVEGSMEDVLQTTLVEGDSRSSAEGVAKNLAERDEPITTGQALTIFKALKGDKGS